MYSINETYRNHILNSITRRPKSKIVVGDTEYTGVSHLKSFPKIEHSTEDMFGSFPAKTCEFEIYNTDGTVNLNGKEISVFRALEIDGSPHWIPMGIFRAENKDITSNLTTKTIKFKGTDRSHLFDVAFNSALHTYPCNLLIFVKQLCANHNIDLENEDFPFYDFELEQSPEFAEGITEREIIRKIAQLGGCMAQITREGKLKISQSEVADIPITSGKYSSLSRENTVYVTGLTLCQSESEDVTAIDDTYVGAYGEFVYRISDNPFIKDRQSEVLASIANCYLGKSVTPFVLGGFIDDFIYDMNDMVTVRDKSGIEFTTPLLSLTTQSRIKSDFKTEVQKEKSSSDGELEGSVKQEIAANKKQGKANEEFIKNFNEKLKTGLEQGSFRKVVSNADGSETTYYFNTPEIENATYIFCFGATGMAWAKGSGCWNGGNPHWQYGATAEGDAILENLLLRTLIADLIRAGTLQSTNGKTRFDLDNAVFRSESEAAYNREFVIELRSGGQSFAVKDAEGNEIGTGSFSARGMSFEQSAPLYEEEQYIAKQKAEWEEKNSPVTWEEYSSSYPDAANLLLFTWRTAHAVLGSLFAISMKSTIPGREGEIIITPEDIVFGDGSKVLTNAPDSTANKVLWSGGIYMHSEQSATLSEAISKQLHGIVLVWSRFDITNKIPLDENFILKFIPKSQVEYFEGCDVIISEPYYAVNKRVWVYDTYIKGDAVNNSYNTVNGIYHYNSNYVLRQVIGV